MSTRSPDKKSYGTRSKTTRPSALLKVTGSSVATKPRSAFSKSVRSSKSKAIFDALLT